MSNAAQRCRSNAANGFVTHQLFAFNTELVLFTNPGSIAQRHLPHRKSILFSRGVRSTETFENVGNVWMQHLVMFEKENRHAMD